MNKFHTILLEKISHIEGWLSPHEALFLYEATNRIKAPGTIVEIGSWKGKSTVALALGIKDNKLAETVAAIDPHQGMIDQRSVKSKSTYFEFIRNIKSNQVFEYVRPIVSTSHGAAKKWNQPIRLLFIDGLHDYDHSKEDYHLWNQYVSIGGIIAFHDGFCGQIGVWKTIKEKFLSSNRLIDIGTVASILYGIKGKPNILQKIRVAFKVQIIYLAQSIYQSDFVPKFFKLIIIHKMLRFFLLSRYTIAIY